MRLAERQAVCLSASPPVFPYAALQTLLVALSANETDRLGYFSSDTVIQKVCPLENVNFSRLSCCVNVAT